MGGPLSGISVIDFSTLLPGPLASLVLAEAGADVTKIERPSGEMRRSDAEFAMLNRHKRSIAIDLKQPEAVSRLAPLIARSDILIEQFRPGVMERLGLGFQAVQRIRPGIIYCSINGYGAEGDRAAEPGHDVNYLANAGMLTQTVATDGSPVLPQALVADIGAGTYPAIINMLLALRERDRTGLAQRIEIAIYDHIFPFMFSGLAAGFGQGDWRAAGGRLDNGGSPRYNIYRCRDGRHVAAAPSEEKFWQAFCGVIGLEHMLRAADADAQVVTRRVAGIIAARDAAEWMAAFRAAAVPCTAIRDLRDAVEEAAFTTRAISPGRVLFGGLDLPAMPVPLVHAYRRSDTAGAAPELGGDNTLLDGA